MIILISLFFLSISLIISRTLTGTIATPLGIFGIVWNGLLILFELRLVAFVPISTFAYILIFGSFAAFLLGATTILYGARVIKNRSRSVLSNIESKDPACNLTTLERFIWIYTLVSLAGFIAWTLRVVAAGGQSALFAANYRAMEIEPMAGGLVGHMMAIGLSGALLAGIYIAYGGKHKLKAGLAILPIIGYSIISGSRVSMVWAFLFFTSPLLLSLGQRRHNHTKPLRYVNYCIFFSLALIAAFIAIGNARSTEPAGTRFQTYANVEMPSGFTHVYVYVTGSFAAFSNLLDSPENDAPPLSRTFTPLLKTYNLLDRQHTVTYQEHYPSTYIPFDFNTYTYLADLYLDFGLFGIIIIPYSLGLISTYLLNKSIYRHPMSYAWASFLCTFLIFALTVSLTAKVEPWTAMIGVTIGIYAAAVAKRTRTKQVHISIHSGIIVHE